MRLLNLLPPPLPEQVIVAWIEYIAERFWLFTVRVCYY
jgi:hypothetical protein